MMSTTKHTKPYLNDGSGCEKCNFTGRFGGWINGHWHGYPQINCQSCGQLAATIAEEIEHTDISTPRREAGTHVMREVYAGTFKRVNAARYGG